MFTRRHMESVAKVIRDIREYDESESVANARNEIAESFAEMFAQSNPNFNRARFLAACGTAEKESE